MSPRKQSKAVRESAVTPRRPRPWIGIAAIVTAILVMIIWLGSWTAEEEGPRGAAALMVLASQGWPALVWMAAAMGYGWLAQGWLAPQVNEKTAMRLAVGAALMLWLDAVLGRLGVLTAVGAWASLIPGLLAFSICGLNVTRRDRADEIRCSWMSLTAAPAVAVLLTAAASAPGWLWRTEFGGYDALSYHLQLPREWLAGGGIEPLTHNVYSFLPSFMEGAYLHLAALMGDDLHFACAAQALHACLALAAAWVIGSLGRALGIRGGGAAGVMAIGTPWVIVAGSLPYNEMPVVLMLAGAWLILEDQSLAPGRRGALVGMLVGAACGAKLTAVGLVAAPLMLLAILAHGKAALKTGAAAFTMIVVVLSPWLVENFITCGNPLFPFFTQWLGLAHWTPEQAATWASAHGPPADWSSRLVAGWNQFFMFGIGESPAAGEPWLPQWSVLPWLGALGLLVAATSRDHRGRAARVAVVLAAQLGFWVLFTHVKSRFMLPAVAPLSLAVMLGVDRVLSLAESPPRRAAGALASLALLGWCCMPVILFHGERQGMPASMIGRIDSLTGDSLPSSQRRELGRESMPAVAVNHLLPEGSRTLLVGEAAPFYYRGSIAYQTTWDRGPLSAVMRESDDPAQWIQALKLRGFTHLLIDHAMVDRWSRAGWNDPQLTTDRLARLSMSAELLGSYPGGVEMLRLPD